MSPERPRAVTVAMWLLVAMVALSGATAFLTLVFEDELVDAWAEGRTDVGSVEPPAFVPVAITLFVVVALLVVVLLMFFRERHNWSRVLLSALVAMMVVATLAGLRTNPPPLFLALALVSLVVDLAAIGALWHKDTRAYVSDSWDVPDHHS